MNNTKGVNTYKQYHQVESHKTSLSTQQLAAVREEAIRSLDFIEHHKYQILQEDYKDLFTQYQHIIDRLNSMIDRNMVQSKYIDPRTVVQTQPLIDGPDDYDIQDWERQFTANNINVQPYTIPPINAWRKTKHFNKEVGALLKQ